MYDSASCMKLEGQNQHYVFYCVQFYITSTISHNISGHELLCPLLRPLKPRGACGQERYRPPLAFKAPLHSGTPQRTSGRSPATSAIWKIQVWSKKHTRVRKLRPNKYTNCPWPCFAHFVLCVCRGFQLY